MFHCLAQQTKLCAAFNIAGVTPLKNNLLMDTQSQIFLIKGNPVLPLAT